MNSFACYDLAMFYLYTDNKEYQDKSKARKPLERACKIGNRRALDLGCKENIEQCCTELQEYKKQKR
jgi:TPR repeat protein